MGPKSFTGGKAPCGRIVDGESHRDEDDQCLVTEDMSYSCGCRSIRHEYHDGSICHKVIHHNGRVLVDEHFSEWPS